MPRSLDGSRNHALMFRTIATDPTWHNFPFFRQKSPKSLRVFKIQHLNPVGVEGIEEVAAQFECDLEGLVLFDLGGGDAEVQETQGGRPATGRLL